ncbi:GGDEF domain-containing protein [Sedimenticola selenatireducens]|uniref:diguanylate cyclase n=1 Tax=Sedimenticola selenatireducens TaxID=191960 RepID=A0A558DUW4_9GAMM|nr:GGDEF domain-containing protein [Sedimenticola selenatireducens]TVO72514.1 GGDEF domain-containing protein [Sedimenticola selenatireducens]TVT64769.1 MAG: GGDEF domain-containing protein [Sedimenticola selenatireducens]
MTSTETPLAPDWKTRYLDLVRQQSTESEAAVETEKLLCRIIIRLTLATGGLDPTLDPHLIALRNAVRKGVKGDLSDRLSAISEALIRAKDEPQSEDVVEVGLLPRLIARSGLTGRNAGKLRKLGEQLIAEGDRVSDDQIDSFLRLLTRPENGSHSRGLLGRLFSSSSAEPSGSETSGVTPNQQLLTLLGSLDWPGQLSQDIKRLELELSVRNDVDVWAEVMTSLVTLLASSLGDVQTEIRDTQGFLEELTRRLVDIDKHVTGSKALREQSRVDGKVLDQVMKHQVEGMRGHMDTATTLTQLRQEIGLKLDAIELHVQTFMDKEGRRHTEAAQLEEHLRQRLIEVQNESRDLRSKMIEAHRQAATDTLTGLPNRLAYEERLEQEFARWKRFGEPLALLVWDIDNFKIINDRFGHNAGDKALRIIGQNLQLGLRETDFVGRFGGEEFVMLLTGSAKEDVLTLADDIRKEVQESGIHSLGNRVEVTICCGFSCFEEGDTPADVFSRADRALYEAKKTGKNCVKSA